MKGTRHFAFTGVAKVSSSPLASLNQRCTAKTGGRILGLSHFYTMQTPAGLAPRASLYIHKAVCINFS